METYTLLCINDDNSSFFIKGHTYNSDIIAYHSVLDDSPVTFWRVNGVRVFSDRFMVLFNKTDEEIEQIKLLFKEKEECNYIN